MSQLIAPIPLDFSSIASMCVQAKRRGGAMDAPTAQMVVHAHLREIRQRLDEAATIAQAAQACADAGNLQKGVELRSMWSSSSTR
jgi:hypothetical protein